MDRLDDLFSFDVLFDGSQSSDDGTDASELVDIFAIPGLGDSSQPWARDNVNWLADENMLPYWLPKTRIMSVTYSHTTLLQDVNVQIGALATKLLRAILAERQDCPRRPIVFIGHSFGGLIIKQAAILCETGHEEFSILTSALAGIVFLGTPHRGAIATTLAAIVSVNDSDVMPDVEAALEKKSESFTDLASHFACFAIVSHVPLFNFFERSPEERALVDEHSATIDGFPSTALAANHSSMCKFAGPDDPNYALVRDRLLAITQGAASCVASRTRFSTEDADQFVSALFAADPADDLEMMEHTKGHLLYGSGSWLQTHPTYKEWLDCKTSRVLWLSGDPGKGKTMLSISVVNFLKERIRVRMSGPSVLLAYFFCDNKDHRRDSAIAVLRGLIFQLLQARPDLSSQFKALFRREGDQLFSSPTALRSLWRIMKDFFASPGVRTVYLVVDALDELHAETVDDFLKLLGPLTKHNDSRDQSTSNQVANCEVKWFLTSRNVRSISSILRWAPRISLEENSGHVRDLVSKFINERVDALRREKGYSNALTSTVTNTLGEISEGTFLYVSLACDALSRPDVRLFNTKKELRTFPKGLNPLYERMMEHIDTSADDEHVKYAKAILRAMVLAVRPLTLRELAVIAELPKEHQDDTSMLLEYTALCGSFITHRQGKVYFVHESVKEYLISIDHVFTKSIHEYHADLVRLFLAMIMKYNQDSLEGGEQSHALAYPRLCRTEHARLAEDMVDWTHYLSQPLFSKTWMDFHWAQYHSQWDSLPEGFHPMHLAAYFGISSLVKALVRRGDPIDALDSNSFTPLMWATKRDHPPVVRLLLELGADHMIEAPGGLTAVFHAAINGHYRALRALVQGDASVRVADRRSRTPLHYAAAYGNVKTLGVLLSAGAEVDARNIGRHTALQQASIHGEVAIVRELMAHNADVTVKDKEGRTLLHLAARASDLNVLKFWLKESSDLESTDDQSWTPLMHAAMLGNDQSVASLIEHGARVKTCTRDGQTALSLAILNTRVRAVQALLDGGVDPNCECAANEMPLMQAAWLGNVAIVQSLLEAGADANAEAKTGSRPLHQAAANGHEISSKLLLRYAADPNALDVAGLTPAARAEENKHYNLKRYLKSREINCEDGGSPIADLADRLPLDPAVCELLQIPPECGFMELVGEEGFSRPAKVTALVHGKATYYFMKSGPNEDMFASEHEALRELLLTVPTICPYSLGHGKYARSTGYFLLMEWMDVVRPDWSTIGGSCLSLPQKLAKLHTIVAKPPHDDEKDPMFGWHRSTYCGSTIQVNAFRASWPKFYAENRLLSILDMIERTHGTDPELRAGVKAIADVVVPRLLGNGHLGGRRGIVPVLVHGDLWNGNKVFGVNSNWGGSEHVVFDPSAAYCHSEYELGIMRAFGGFTAGFFEEYHSIVPKTEPIREYEDRVELYKLYHYLNHYLIFRGAYKDNAMDVVKRLADKYLSFLEGGMTVLRLL